MERRYLNNSRNYYDLFLLDGQKRGLIVIAPGGGYSHTSPREAEPVASVFARLGFHTAIFYYREEKDFFPKPQEEVKEMVDALRGLQEIDENKILGCGFSAGGHLILSSQFLGYVNFSGLIMGYPVVSADEKIAHAGSVSNLLGNKAKDEEYRKLVSIENQVKENAPDLFLWTTITDQAVPMENSMRLVEAYRNASANCEFHLYPLGTHGLSLANEETAVGDSSKVIPHVAGWVELLKNWIKLKY